MQIWDISSKKYEILSNPDISCSKKVRQLELLGVPEADTRRALTTHQFVCTPERFHKKTNESRQKRKQTRELLPKEERKPTLYCYCKKKGYVRVPYGDIEIMRYRLVAQWKLGRPLRNGEQVHHINGIKHDDRPSNLQIVNWKEHCAIHSENSDVPTFTNT